MPKIFINRLKLSFALFGLLIFAWSCGNREIVKIEGKQKLITDNKSVEASIFRQQCVVCHGVEAHGKTLGERVIPSLRFGKPASDSDEELYRQISVGGNGMPAFQSILTEPQIRAMVVFIRRDLQGKDNISK